MRYISLIFTLFLFTSAYAQVEEDDMLNILRPEHVYEYAEGGVRRLPMKVGSRAGASLVCKGSPKVPIVLVQFPDRPFSAAGKSEEEILHSYDMFFNGRDNEEVQRVTGSHGSIRNYFLDQSLGQFAPEFVIIGPVTLNNGYAEYGRNNGSSKDVNVSKFYREALTKTLSERNVDWKQFDNDNNGVVDMVFFIHAGWGENTVKNYDPDAIWAKEGSSSLTVTADNGQVTIFGCYGVCAEARYKSSAKLKEDVESGNYGTTGYNPENLSMDGIGVCVHELSHALGLPDFYDTRYVAYGMDLWSVMDYGEYGQNGFWPGGYTAYERDFMGWQPLVELTDTCILDIKCFAEGGVGYKIVNEANEDEYYIIENRQPIGWDEIVCKKGRGLMVTHVDYLASRWNSNSVNTDAAHQRMTIIAANDSYIGTNNATSATEWMESLKGNMFPYIQPTQSLTDTTVPAAKVYAGGTMHKPLFDIMQNEDSTVTVYYLKPKADYDKELEDAIRTVDTNSMVDVYALNGMHICRCFPEDLHRQSFRRGIYLLKLPEGDVRKVLLQY